MRGWSDNARIGTAVAVMTTACASLGCGAAAAPDVGETVQTDERPPNIVWIVADELRPPLEQHVGALAAAGVSFSRTLPVATVSASVRSALLTGMHPAAIGLAKHGLSAVPAAGVTVLPEQLRRAGYYTSRAGPARHNLAVTVDEAWEPAAPTLDQPGLLGAWDAAGSAADWRGRAIDWDGPCTVSFGCGRQVDHSGSPFFTLYTLTTTGTSLDRAVGEILTALEADGLVETTAVFLVGGQASGASLIVRWPDGIEPGTTRDDPVSVVDLAPTALALAGVPVPAHMQGRVFLGPTTAAPLTDHALTAMSSGKVRATTWSGDPPTAATPAGYPTGGLFHVAPRVELSCETEGATIIYTTDLVAPFRWRLYQGPFRMRFWTLRARCGRLGYRDSDVVSYDFDIE